MNYCLLHISNFNCIKIRRLQKEIGVLHRIIIDGNDDFLNCYKKFKEKVTNSNIIENIRYHRLIIATYFNKFKYLNNKR